MNQAAPIPIRQGAERELRLLSYVGRWQIVQVNRRQTLSDHLYQVAILAWRLVEDCDLQKILRIDMGDLFREALLHDLPETLSGDIPSPVHQKIKKADGWKAWLTQRVIEFFPWYEEKPSYAVKYVVSICDLLEACLFLSEETQMGNQYVEPHLAYLLERLEELLEVKPPVAATTEHQTEAYVEQIRVRIKNWVNATLERSTEPAKVLLNP